MVEQELELRGAGSPYMNWAKLHSHAKWNLATSGVPAYPLAKLGVSIEDLEIGGPTLYGYDPLLAAVSERYGVAKNSIVLANGCSGANHVAMSFFLRHGDRGLVEDPTYECIADTAKFTGARVERFGRVPEQDWGLNFEEIEQGMVPETTLIAVTNLHNPTSALLDEDALRRLGGIAAANGAYVLVDEAYLDCLWEKRPKTAFHLGPNFIVTGSLTKVYGLSGLRCGWIFAPPAIASKIWRMNDLFSVNQAHPAERLGVIAFSKLDRIGAESRMLIEGNHAIWREFVPALSKYLECGTPEFGSTTFPRLRAGSAEQFCERLRAEYETSVVPGHFFGMPDRFRVSLVSQPETLREGLRRILTLLSS